MGQISDDLRLGPVTLPANDYLSAGNPAPMAVGVGPMGRTYMYDIVPATLGAALLAAAQAGTGGIVTLVAGAGITSRVDSANVSRFELDVPRNITVTAAGANATTATVVGYDVYGQRMTESFAAPSTSTVAGNKAFKSIVSVTFSGTPGSNVSVGYGDKFGLPYRVIDAGYIHQVKWANTLAADAGTFVAAVTTDPATAATGDVRGTYTPSSASNGARRLVMLLGLPAIASGPQATRSGAAGVTQA